MGAFLYFYLLILLSFHDLHARVACPAAVAAVLDIPAPKGASRDTPYINMHARDNNYQERIARNEASIATLKKKTSSSELGTRFDVLRKRLAQETHNNSEIKTLLQGIVIELRSLHKRSSEAAHQRSAMNDASVAAATNGRVRTHQAWDDMQYKAEFKQNGSAIELAQQNPTAPRIKLNKGRAGYTLQLADLSEIPINSSSEGAALELNNLLNDNFSSPTGALTLGNAKPGAPSRMQLNQLVFSTLKDSLRLERGGLDIKAQSAFEKAHDAAALLADNIHPTPKVYGLGVEPFSPSSGSYSMYEMNIMYSRILEEAAKFASLSAP